MYPLVGRLDRNRRTLGLVRISIHAPLAGCDAGRGRFCRRREDFNPRTPCGVRQFCQCRQRVYVSISIHAPLAGCDTATLTWQRSYEQFQSTHPLRGATDAAGGPTAKTRRFQSTHPLRGATQVLRLTELLSLVFQSTHPLRGATPRRTANRSGFPISIHAPLAGCDARRTAH